jgi:3-deoxy-D-manno-octulosonate 8-phosphate phosphatase KdsC-like HAD superfamily phosphatase
LQSIREEVLREVPGAAIASDQFTRLFDLAIDFCEDVPPLPKESVEKIVAIFAKYGATAKVSSIHVNGWFGDYNKRSMCEQFYQTHTGKRLSDSLQSCAFVGDSPNDEPLFEFFTHAFAVANIKEFQDQLQHPPKYVASLSGGQGFVEIGEKILANLT